jgi:hypothetical protein
VHAVRFQIVEGDLSPAFGTFHAIFVTVPFLKNEKTFIVKIYYIKKRRKKQLYMQHRFHPAELCRMMKVTRMKKVPPGRLPEGSAQTKSVLPDG